MSSRRGRGEGSIRELPDGRWRAWLSAGAGAAGKRHRPSRTCPTKKEALAWLRARQAEQGQGRLADAGRITVGEWLDRYLAGRLAEGAKASHDHDEPRVRLFLKPALGSIRLSALTALQVKGMLEGMAVAGKSSSEREKVGSALRRALGEAVRMRLLSHNVARDVKLPRVVRPEKVCLTQPQAVAFLRAAEGLRLSALFVLALDSAMRPGELFGLHWPEVDLVTGTVYVRQSLSERDGRLELKPPKTARGRRRIRLAPRTVEALQAHRERMQAEGRDVEAGPVFCAPMGGLLRRPHFYRQAFLPARTRAGLPPFRPYDLRHTSATLLLMDGVSIVTVSARLGHANAAVTLKHYAHYLPVMEDRAVEAATRLFGT